MLFVHTDRKGAKVLLARARAVKVCGRIASCESRLHFYGRAARPLHAHYDSWESCCERCSRLDTVSLPATTQEGAPFEQQHGL